MVERIWSYAWASPNTAIGFAFGLLAVLFGAQLRPRQGVFEFSGGGLGRLFAAPWLACPFRAVTLGHVILGYGCGQRSTASRTHEQVHVRQYEQWGPLFLPAYCGLQPLAARLRPTLLSRQLVRAAGI